NSQQPEQLENTKASIFDIIAVLIKGMSCKFCVNSITSTV
ncbi:22209_t:CDS:1, partial [Gigaspora rosea]